MWISPLWGTTCREVPTIFQGHGPFFSDHHASRLLPSNRIFASEGGALSADVVTIAGTGEHSSVSRRSVSHACHITLQAPERVAPRNLFRELQDFQGLFVTHPF